MKDKSTHKYRTFPGNYDSDSVVTQYFDKMVNARYLRITPVKWHASIGMRLEVIGCYRPYIHIPTQMTSTEVPVPQYPDQSQQVDCEACPGLPRAFINIGTCSCSAGLVWDGTKCVPLELCPCFIDEMR